MTVVYSALGSYGLDKALYKYKPFTFFLLSPAKSNETFTLKDCLTQDQSRPPSADPPAQDLADSKDDE